MSEAAADLLGALAYASLTAFGRTAADAERAPSLAARATLSRLAVAGYRIHEALVAELVRRGVEPELAMAPFVPPIDAFHARTRSGDWFEGLLGSYVLAGLAEDFAEHAAAIVDEPLTDVLRDLGATVAAQHGRQFVEDAIREVLAADPAVAGRLALWSRRLLGEALSQAQRVAADRIELTRLLGGGLAEFGGLLVQVADRHAERMRALGLG